jgi:flagellar M-ring protein FliF
MATELINANPGSQTPTLRAQKLLENPLVRQLGVMIGIALSVALGVAVVLWSRTPSYSPLYANLDRKSVV